MTVLDLVYSSLYFPTKTGVDLRFKVTAFRNSFVPFECHTHNDSFGLHVALL